MLRFAFVLCSLMAGCDSDPAEVDPMTCGYTAGAPCSGKTQIDFCFCRKDSAVFVCCIDGKVTIDQCSEMHYGCGIYGVDTGTRDSPADSESDAAEDSHDVD